MLEIGIWAPWFQVWVNIWREFVWRSLGPVELEGIMGGGVGGRGLGCGRGHQAVLPGEPGVGEKLEEQEGRCS